MKVLYLMMLKDKSMCKSAAQKIPVKHKLEEPDEDITSLLEGADVAWAQYKCGQGTRITSDEELDAFMDSL
jgi:hypothetical protein